MEDNLYYKYGKTTDSCKNCPCKLYNTDKVIYLGRGNIYNRIIFILPQYNINKSSPVEEEILNDIVTSLYNINLFDIVYVTRMIKCYSPLQGVSRNSVNYCYNILHREIIRINPKQIYLFGIAYNDLANIIRDKTKYTGELIYLHNPKVKMFDEDKFNTIINTFKEKLIL